jgi:hypothetical protein
MMSFMRSAPPTQPMHAVGLSFDDIAVQAQHVVHLLQTQGDTALRVVTNTLKLVKAVTGRDMLTVFALINQETVDIQTLTKAIQDEFGL